MKPSKSSKDMIANLKVLHIFIGTVLQQGNCSFNIVNCCCQCKADFPVKREWNHQKQCNLTSGARTISFFLVAFTDFITRLTISMAGDQLFHHAFYCQDGLQDQSSGAIIHACIQVCGTVLIRIWRSENMGYISNDIVWIVHIYL